MKEVVLGLDDVGKPVEDNKIIKGRVEKILAGVPSLSEDKEVVRKLEERIRRHYYNQRFNKKNSDKLKNGRAFVIKHADKITMYAFTSTQFDIGFTIGIMQKDKAGKLFDVTLAECSKNDMANGRWSDRIARSIVGARLMEMSILDGGYSGTVSFDRKQEPMAVVMQAFYKYLSVLVVSNKQYSKMVSNDSLYLYGEPFKVYSLMPDKRVGKKAVKEKDK
jgi:hypothetical protein